jgi:hypothetical protein
MNLASTNAASDPLIFTRREITEVSAQAPDRTSNLKVALPVARENPERTS